MQSSKVKKGKPNYREPVTTDHGERLSGQHGPRLQAVQALFIMNVSSNRYTVASAHNIAWALFLSNCCFVVFLLQVALLQWPAPYHRL